MEKFLTHCKGSSQVDILNFSKKLKSLHLTGPEKIYIHAVYTSVLDKQLLVTF
jgi:hypothetical protein